MSIEIFRMTNEGVGWVDISEATSDEKMNIELGLMTNQFQMMCFKCHKPIPKGNVCFDHKDVRGGIYLD